MRSTETQRRFGCGQAEETTPRAPASAQRAWLLAAVLLLANPTVGFSQTPTGPDLLVEIPDVQASTIGVGASTRVNFRVTNTGATAVDSFDIAIAWPASLQVDGGRIAPFRCTGGNCDFETSTGLYEYRDGALGTGESTELSLYFFGTAEDADAVVTASMATVFPDEDPVATAPNVAETTIVVSGEAVGPDAEVSLQTPVSDLLAVGDRSRLTVRVANLLTDAPLRSFSLRFDLDSALAVRADSYHMLTCPEATCQFNHATRVFEFDGALGARQFVSFTIEVVGLQARQNASATVSLVASDPAEGPGASATNSRTRFLDILTALDPGNDAPTTYYIDADLGSDSNPGTASEPFATIQHCVNTWDPRGEAVVEHIACRGRGIFHEEVEIFGGGPSPFARNLLAPWDTDGDSDLRDETFILDGQNTRNIAIKAVAGSSPRNVEIAHMTIRNYWPDGDWRCDPEAPRPPDERLSFFDLRTNSGADDWWIHHNHLTDLATGCAFPSANSQFMMVRPTNANNLIFEDNLVERIYSSYLFRYFSGWGVRIRRNTFREFQQGPKIWGAGAYGVRDIEIVDNVYDCADFTWSAGGFSNDVRDGAIRGNHFSNCRNSINLGTGNGGTDDSYALVVENNIIDLPDRGSPTGINISDCAAQSTSSGEFLELSDLVVRNNVLRGVRPGMAGSGVFLRSGHLHPFHNDFRLVGNSFLNLEHGIRVGACVLAESSDLPVLHEVEGLSLMGNLYDGVSDAYDIRTPRLPMDFESDGNVFPPDTRFTWLEGEVTHNSKVLADWQTIAGQDAVSSACSPTYLAAGDWHLASEDTCALDAGWSTPDLTLDYDGDRRPYGDHWDAGADELPIGLPPPSTTTTTSTTWTLPNPTTTTSTSTTTLGAGLPGPERGCILAVNKRARKVMAAADRQARRCVRRAQSDATEDLYACMTATDRRLERMTEKLRDDAATHCSGLTPAWGYPGADTSIASASEYSRRAMQALFGIDPRSTLLSRELDRTTADCQALALRTVYKEAERGVRSFVRCKSQALANQSTATVNAVSSCVATALAGTNPRRTPLRRIQSKFASRCQEVAQGTAFPGNCAVAGDVATCAHRDLRCEFCRTINAVDALSVNCDEFDDETANGSCAGT